MAPSQHDDRQSGVGLALTTAAFLFVLVRLFAVSGGDWHTAFAVLHTLDLNDGIGIVLGTLMGNSLIAASFLALLVPVAAFRAATALRGIWEGRRHVLEGQPTEPLHVNGLLLLLITLMAMFVYTWSFHAWWVPLLAAVVGAVVLGIARAVRTRPQRAVRWVSHHLGVLIVAAMLTAAATTDIPWVPLERIGLHDGNELRGYVMQAEPGFLKVLTERDREFLIVPDTAVTSRQEIPVH
ncbi:hypothetical protein [Parasphingorhabdus pacifica]